MIVKYSNRTVSQSFTYIIILARVYIDTLLLDCLVHKVLLIKICNLTIGLGDTESNTL